MSRILLTCAKPRCTEAVSDMYIIFPSGATTKMNPSRECNKYEPNSFIGGSLGFGGAGVAPQASPKPAAIKRSKLRSH